MNLLQAYMFMRNKIDSLLLLHPHIQKCISLLIHVTKPTLSQLCIFLHINRHKFQIQIIYFLVIRQDQRTLRCLPRASQNHYQMTIIFKLSHKNQVFLQLESVSNFLQSLDILVWKYDIHFSHSHYIQCFFISNLHLTKIPKI